MILNCPTICPKRVVMNELFYLAVRHDDWCLYWSTDDPGCCNCTPEYEYTEITDDNQEQIIKEMARNEDAARKTRRGKRN